MLDEAKSNEGVGCGVSEEGTGGTWIEFEVARRGKSYDRCWEGEV